MYFSTLLSGADTLFPKPELQLIVQDFASFCTSLVQGPGIDSRLGHRLPNSALIVPETLTL